MDPDPGGPKTSVADPDPGSGAFLTPGSGIRNRFFPDPGSRIPDLRSQIPKPYFLELSDNFLGKKFYHSLKIGPNFFLHHFKTKIIFNFVKFVATQKGMTIFFHPSLLLLFLDPGWVKSGSKNIRILTQIPNTGRCSTRPSVDMLSHTGNRYSLLSLIIPNQIPPPPPPTPYPTP
jgi:hypothetical protein